jgi:hypothetical protein
MTIKKLYWPESIVAIDSTLDMRSMPLQPHDSIKQLEGGAACFLYSLNRGGFLPYQKEK